MMRTCKCEVKGIKDMDYCPKCGNHAFAEEEVPIPEMVDGNIGEYQIHDINDDMIISIPDTYATDDDYVMHQVKIPENINEIRENMKKTLEPLGLWDDDDFGVWSGLEGNY